MAIEVNRRYLIVIRLLRHPLVIPRRVEEFPENLRLKA
jgi:hypothetical protein